MAALLDDSTDALCGYTSIVDGHSKGFVVEQFPFYVNDFICLHLRVIVKGNPLFVLIPGLDGTRMCRVFATFLLLVRNKVCNADIWVFVEVR